jgi:hypothetical protein
VNPFTDVQPSDYFCKAVLWANEQGITNGTSATTFGANDACTRAHVVTFLWRAEGKPAAGSANPFGDVPSGQYYTEAVLWAVSRNITNGTGPAVFSPGSPCTRGQVVTFLWRAAGSPKPATTKNPFGDVTKDAYYYDAVLWAVENEITTGTSQGKFSPDKTCTRGQVATFLWRSQQKPRANNSENPFTDIQESDYYYEAVLWAAEKGITTGVGQGLFAPNRDCTRGQIVTFLYRAMS